MLELRDGLVIHSLFFIDQREAVNRKNEVRVHVQCLTQLLDSLIVLTVKRKNPTNPRIDRQRERIKILRSPYFCQRLFASYDYGQVDSVPEVGLRIVGIELNGFLEFSLCTSPVSVVIIRSMGQRHVGLGKRFIELHCFQRGDLCFWQHLLRGPVSSSLRSAYEIISISETRVSEREVRISIDRLLKIFERLFKPVITSLVPIKPTL